ncbi:ATP-binding cassette domain-containing protein [Clostridium felsineum]|uniref:ATP-binding cassette domain-containing protein n=1 Tax=Clostridium felsineum TaxID=36839 RepID=UPI0014738954|nr:ABC transporter ATP-binding protein [Clostridium felsineum]
MIKLNNITCLNSYNHVIFKNLNINFRLGKKYLIIGDNGCGKTTLLNIIYGLYRNYKGNILYSDSITKLVAYVPQCNYLFNETIKNNLIKSLDYYDSDYLHELLKIMKLYHYMKKLPDGLNTKVNNSTKSLSSGQIQKIKLIRGFLSNKRILMIDEALSNLNNDSLISILNFLRDNYDKTLIIVSHQTNLIINHLDPEIIDIKDIANS